MHKDTMLAQISPNAMLSLYLLMEICKKKSVKNRLKNSVKFAIMQNALHTWQNIQHARIPREIGWILVYVVKALGQS